MGAMFGHEVHVVNGIFYGMMVLYSIVCILALSFDHVTHLHSSVQASDCGVDEASDNSVQDKGQNLKRSRNGGRINYKVSSQLACPR